jgi:hypothetical protein
LKVAEKLNKSNENNDKKKRGGGIQHTKGRLKRVGENRKAK